jgi:Ca-activated chloride channel family protein
LGPRGSSITSADMCTDRIKIAFLIAAMVAAAAQSPGPKQPAARGERKEVVEIQGGNDQPLRLGTELVNVFFSAIDRNNRIVSDIGQQEVELLEDGVPQRIFTFKREVNLPINIALLIDVSGSQEYTFPQEKAAASYFLRSIMRPGKDLAAILTFREEVDLIQGLTSKIDSLNRALDEVQYASRSHLSSRSQATALYDAIYITVDEVLGQGHDLAALTEGQAPRRAIILLTDGVDNASGRKLEEAVERAWRSGVIIYSIGIGDRFRFEGVREDVLRRLSEETGGRAYFPRGADELAESFRQIEEELRSQYLVAYAPSNTARDGRFRRIELRIPGRPDVRIISRRGYYAPAQ